MSFEFSRRNFLKYTAVAAVAVAGASLFTGCAADADNIILSGAGMLDVLNITATMGTYSESSKTYTAPDITGKTIVFPMKITNERTNPISINPYNFKAIVVDAENKTLAKYTFSNGLNLAASLIDTNLKNGSSVEGNVTLTLSTVLTKDQSVILTYCPDLQYNEYSMSWKLTR